MKFFARYFSSGFYFYVKYACHSNNMHLFFINTSLQLNIPYRQNDHIREKDTTNSTAPSGGVITLETNRLIQVEVIYTHLASSYNTLLSTDTFEVSRFRQKAPSGISTKYQRDINEITLVYLQLQHD